MHPMRHLCATAMFLCFCCPSFGAVFDLPSAVVPSTAASGGPSFVLSHALLPTDSLRGMISGTVDFDSSNGANYSADWNAAGVVVRSRSTRLSTGGTDPTFVDMGWLRLALGNDAIGFYPLLETIAENGLGSPSPQEHLLLNRTVGEIFDSPGFSGLAAGTILQYRVYDSPTEDNSGSFVVSAVPEPSSIVIFAATAVAGALTRRLTTRRS